MLWSAAAYQELPSSLWSLSYVLESVNATSLINIKLALASRDYLSFAYHMDYSKSKKLEKMISHSFLLSLYICLLWAGAEGDFTY